MRTHRFTDRRRLLASLVRVNEEIFHWERQSRACPHCSGDCWCDGEWSPAARLLNLYREQDRVRGLLA